ncbi:hypothetical protein Csa_007543 [Cucumis sativus]|uniref:Uncharacterized protein n=1 Tax=Cucumis sativus TaxID=3659 RepID=A0A0A0LYH5_CUCSA|nr:hypothetical protein Csa_007543 [Cucumis sativus]
MGDDGRVRWATIANDKDVQRWSVAFEVVEFVRILSAAFGGIRSCSMVYERFRRG